MTNPALPRPENDPPPMPPFTLIPCGARGFRARQASACFNCEHFRGVVRISEDAAGLPWDKTFVISCAFPVERRVQTIEA